MHFYRHYFSDVNVLALARNRFVIDEPHNAAHLSVFIGNDYEQDSRTLKQARPTHGVAVPALYKQYTETCESGGVKFLDFNVDAKFANCVDGLVLADPDQLKPVKRGRYPGDRRSPLVVPPVPA